MFLIWSSCLVPGPVSLAPYPSCVQSSGELVDELAYFVPLLEFRPGESGGRGFRRGISSWPTWHSDPFRRMIGTIFSRSTKSALPFPKPRVCWVYYSVFCRAHGCRMDAQGIKDPTASRLTKFFTCGEVLIFLHPACSHVFYLSSISSLPSYF